MHRQLKFCLGFTLFTKRSASKLSTLSYGFWVKKANPMRNICTFLGTICRGLTDVCMSSRNLYPFPNWFPVDFNKNKRAARCLLWLIYLLVFLSKIYSFYSRTCRFSKIYASMKMRNIFTSSCVDRHSFIILKITGLTKKSVDNSIFFCHVSVHKWLYQRDTKDFHAHKTEIWLWRIWKCSTRACHE